MEHAGACRCVLIFFIPCRCFFLSHFHADHYGGLGPSFDRGQIFCSQVTANLLITALGVSAACVRPLPMRQEVSLQTGEPGSAPCYVTLIDANHCPGAVCFIFRLPSGKTHLHTGDFRFDQEHPDHYQLTQRSTPFDSVYLDTTYCDRRYDFPAQRLVVHEAIQFMKSFLPDPRTLFVVGAYTIGKERIFLKAAQEFQFRVLCSASKYKILSCLCLPPEELALITKDEESARIHVVPIGTINLKGMEKYLRSRPRWKRVVALKPTGWTFAPLGAEDPAKAPCGNNIAVKSKTLPGGLQVVTGSLPYSEHSSFGELRAFVSSVKSRTLIPTVNNYNGEKVREMVRLLKQ